jgi:hypothetical protein
MTEHLEPYQGPAKYAMYGQEFMQEWFTYTYYKLSATLNRAWDLTPCTTLTVSPKWTPDYFLYMYNKVGKDYKWWYFNWKEPKEVEEYLQEKKAFITLLVDGEPSGFAIVKNEDDDSCNLEYFGLMNHVHGRGLGKKFLLDIMRLASYSRNNIWVYTTDLDHPAALPTYKSCGFKVLQEKLVSEYYPITVIGDTNAKD